MCSRLFWWLCRRNVALLCSSSQYFTFRFPILVECSFCQINRSILINHNKYSTKTETSTLQTQRHGYSGHFYFIKTVGILILSFHAINLSNLNVVSLFTGSSFSVFNDVRRCNFPFWLDDVFSKKYILTLLQKKTLGGDI